MGHAIADENLGRLVILNGPPRAGKTSIAHAMQALLPELWLNLGLEAFKSATPERFQPGIGLRPGGERPDLEPIIERLYLSMYESIGAHCRRGVNVVADTTHHDWYSRPLSLFARCAQLVVDLPVLIVGVRCPLEVIMRRRQDTWGRSYAEDGSVPEPILRWQEAAHAPGIYDVDIDTSQTTPEAAAQLIASHLQASLLGDAARALAHAEIPGE